ncbi:DUF4326 domain-containing protein [Leucobacter chromiiresistens]
MSEEKRSPGNPHRIQLSRRKGWRKPENTTVVARPSRWGNPFVVGGVAWFTTLHGRFGGSIRDRATAVQFFREWFQYSDDENARAARDMAREELVGRNLACWCPLDQPCHADVLLQTANGELDDASGGESAELP